jgi:hypothetical protein
MYALESIREVNRELNENLDIGIKEAEYTVSGISNSPTSNKERDLKLTIEEKVEVLEILIKHFKELGYSVSRAGKVYIKVGK